MRTSPPRELRRGWTTGACATAATRAALIRLWSGTFPNRVSLVLPRGEMPVFDVAHRASGAEGAGGGGWAEAGVVKDAGDDPDVTHGCLVIARVARSTGGIVFLGGPGVGTVSLPGLPIGPGEPAINPVPRAMMRAEVDSLAAEYGQTADITITISIPGGEAIAQRTWNPRLGIVGGLSILGTTGVVRPFSCAAWIASIHRGIDVARAAGLEHVAGCTGAQSEAAVQRRYGLSDHAMLDMGDFVGGMVKYLCRHPVPRLTVGGGLAKMAKIAQGARDLHSSRTQVDFPRLSRLCGIPGVADARTVLHSFQIAGMPLAEAIAEQARRELEAMVAGTGMSVDTAVCDRDGVILATAR